MAGFMRCDRQRGFFKGGGVVYSLPRVMGLCIHYSTNWFLTLVEVMEGGGREGPQSSRLYSPSSRSDTHCSPVGSLMSSSSSSSSALSYRPLLHVVEQSTLFTRTVLLLGSLGTILLLLLSPTLHLLRLLLLATTIHGRIST